MAFGRSKELAQEQTESSGRFVVERVREMISGKKFCSRNSTRGTPRAIRCETS